MSSSSFLAMENATNRNPKLGPIVRLRNLDSKQRHVFWTGLFYAFSSFVVIVFMLLFGFGDIMDHLVENLGLKSEFSNAMITILVFVPTGIYAIRTIRERNDTDRKSFQEFKTLLIGQLIIVIVCGTPVALLLLSLNHILSDIASALSGTDTTQTTYFNKNYLGLLGSTFSPILWGILPLWFTAFYLEMETRLKVNKQAP